jgi:putative spermidine/putrescine transport system permease protein
MSIWFRGGIGLVYGFIFAPLIVVVLVSFNGGTIAALPLESLSLRWYAKALATPSIVDSTITSLWLAGAAVACSTPIALAAALGVAYGRFRHQAAIEAGLLGPLLVPGIVIGIALLVAFSTIGFRAAPLRLLAAHCLIALPYTTRTILASLARQDASLRESARTLGAGDLAVFWHVTLPLLRPGIVAGMIFAFLQSLGDVPVTMFLTDARNNTLPLAIMANLEYNADPSTAAISSMVTVACLALALLLERLFGLRRAVAV